MRRLAFRRDLYSLCILFGFAGAGVDLAASAGGLTFITHGLNGDVNGWVNGMARAITNYPTLQGSGSTIYRLHFAASTNGYDLNAAREAGAGPTESASGEIIIKFDWSQMADGNSYNTYQVASAAGMALLSKTFIPELGGHALAEFPLHLIGHSRGGSLICELSRILGTNGIWVDHLTTLDPHPLNNDGFNVDQGLYSAVDAPARTYANVLFHDNYWQDSATIVYGEAVAGAYVRKLYDVSGGYEEKGDLSYPHSNVHLFYHGTVNLNTPASDSEAGVGFDERRNWYAALEGRGAYTGFYFSRIAGGNRLSQTRAFGAGHPAVRDGYNQKWDLGAGTNNNRTALATNTGAWPSLISVTRADTNQFSDGAVAGLNVYYQFAQPAGSVANLSFYLDDDLNPLDGNELFLQNLMVPATGATGVGFSNINLTLPNGLQTNFHALLVRIDANGNQRFMYAADLPSHTNLLTEIPALTFNGLLFDEANGASAASSGTFKLTSTRSGKYSGNITLAGTRYPFSGRLTAEGNGTNVLKSRGLPLELTFQMVPEFQDGQPGIVGTLTSTNWQEQVLATPAWNSRTSCPWQGQYTLVFPGDAALTNTPGGNGYGTLKLDKKGNIRMSGALADGTKLSQSTKVSAFGDWDFCASLYKRGGMILAPASFSTTTGTNLEGRVLWLKPALPTAKYYPGPFSREFNLLSSTYNRATGVFSGTNQLLVYFTGAELTTGVTNFIAIDSRNRVTNLSSNKLTLHFTASTGLLRGKVTLPDYPRPISFSGTVLQSTNTALGYFLGTAEGGSVVIAPQ